MSLQDCPCGLEGLNCSELSSRLDELDDAMQDLCSTDGFSECFVSSTYGTKCVCKCGFKGEFCEDEVSPEIFNQIISFVLPLALLFVALWKIKSAKVKTSIDEVTMPNFGNKSVLLGYRVSMFVFGIAVLVYVTVMDSITELLYFTNWAWSALTFLFGLGAYLSYHGENTSGVEFLAKVYVVTFEIIFVLSLLIDCVVLYPVLSETDKDDEIIVPSSYIVHGANVVFLLVDLVATRVVIRQDHFWFTLVALAAYSVHSAIYLLIRDLLGARMCSLYDFFDQDDAFMAFRLLGFILSAFVVQTFAAYISRAKAKLFHPKVMILDLKV